jgi:hypothetical protein
MALAEQTPAMRTGIPDRLLTVIEITAILGIEERIGTVIGTVND